MFTDGGQQEWQHVLDRVAVVATSGNSIQNACLENQTQSSPKNCDDLGIDKAKSLDQFFRFLRSHHIHSALEIGLLMDTQLVAPSNVTPACGKEAFGHEKSLRNVLQKIKDAGGDLDYIRMDEPFYYGTVDCKDTVENIAADINLTVLNIVNQYFPEVQIGDVEPLDNLPDNPGLLGRWADAYASATGKRLAFFQVDPAWSNDLIFRNFAETGNVMKERSIPFGVMYTSEDDSSDLGWTQSAIRHFTLSESGFHVDVDQPDFQSWTAHPTNMLPEQEPGTLMNVAYQYLLPQTNLSIVHAGGSNNQVQVKLTAAGQTPVAGANIRVEAIDARKTWPMTNRVIRGLVPANAAYGVIGVRANIEGSRMAVAAGEVDLGVISLDYKDAASTERTWQSHYPTPRKIQLSPTTIVSNNLSAPGSASCQGIAAVPLAPGSPYTLNDPMSATASADHGGYVTIIFLDSSCKGVMRSNLYFSPSSQVLNIAPSTTNAKGQLLFNIPNGIQASSAELRAYYDGDNLSHRSSLAILRSMASK